MVLLLFTVGTFMGEVLGTRFGQVHVHTLSPLIFEFKLKPEETQKTKVALPVSIIRRIPNLI